MTTPKRLFFDIETSPNIGLFWSAGFKLNIAPENIIKERAIICICYKWQGQDKVYSLQWDSKQEDKKMLTEFIKIANECDEDGFFLSVVAVGLRPLCSQHLG